MVIQKQQSPKCLIFQKTSVLRKKSQRHCWKTLFCLKILPPLTLILFIVKNSYSLWSICYVWERYFTDKKTGNWSSERLYICSVTQHEMSVVILTQVWPQSLCFSHLIKLTTWWGKGQFFKDELENILTNPVVI